MSGAGENRSWARPQGGRGNRNSGSNTPNKEGGRQQAMAALSGNAWGGKGKAAGGADRGQAPGQPAAAQADQHVPVKEFNAAEVKDWLKKRYLESVGGTSSSSNGPVVSNGANRASKDQPSVYHKVQGDSVAKRSSGAWGSRGNMPHLMPSGQDFFTQLKKQLASLEKSS